AVKSAIKLTFAAPSLDGTPLVKETFIREATVRREREVDKTLRKESHEGNHHKRVCIVGIDRNHCPCARAGLSFRHTRSVSGKRVFAIGADSVWRCREWDQWLWPPHGPSRIPTARKPRGATVKRGPHIMRKPPTVVSSLSTRKKANEISSNH